jgi:hypothetical protein
MVLAALSLSSAAFSQTTSVIPGSGSDFEPRLRTDTNINDPGPSVTAGTIRVGFQANFKISSAYFFQLPTLGAGESIVNASFLVNEVADSAATAVTPLHNADLVALGFTNANPPANTTAESASYFYVGEGAADTAPGHLLIQDNFLQPGDFIAQGGDSAAKTTDITGSANLAAYLNSLYADPGFAAGSSYVILRLSPDQVSGAGTSRYTIASADNAAEGLRPSLTLTVVPEPSTITLLGLGGVAALFALRKKN